jgi:hypothetical protein
MSQDELVTIYKAKHEEDKKSWEQTRLLCFYNIISMNGTKTYKKPSDLFTFSWEKKKSRVLTKEEALKRLNGKR